MPDQSPPRAASRRRAAVLVGLAALVAPVIAGLGVAAPAQAHNYLTASTPAVDETLTALPAAFSITTNEGMLDVTGEAAGFALQVRDASGLYYGDGCLVVEGSTLSAGASLGAPGAYTVLWQVVSADGHTVDGEYSFTWQPAAETPAQPGSTQPPACEPEVTTQAEAPATESPTAPPPADEMNQGAPPTSGDSRPASETVPLGDVLWIGGALLAVAAAAIVAVIVAGRRSRRPKAD